MEPLSRHRERLAAWPRFLEWVERGARGRVETSPHGEAGVLMVDGVHLVSPLDPEREAKLLADGVADDRREVWCFGLGEGRVIEKLLQRTSCERLHVVGLSRRATRATLESSDAAWLADVRLVFHAPGELDARAFAEHDGARALSSAELRLAEPSALRDAMLMSLAKAHQARWLEGRKEARAARALSNHARFADDGDVSSLFDTRPGAHAVVAGGGPSLVPVVTSVTRDDVLLVAVTTALAPLEKQGVVPDVVVAIDAHPALLAHLTALRHLERLARVPLVYAVDVDPDVLAAWPGPRLAAHLRLPGYESIVPRRGALFCSGTVAHAAVDLAVRMGATQVRFAGLDFAFPGGASHAEGAAFSARRAGRVEVEDVNGGLVGTDINLLGYLRDLERYVGEHPAVRFVNGSLAGARIAGAAHEPPEERP